MIKYCMYSLSLFLVLISCESDEGSENQTNDTLEDAVTEQILDSHNAYRNDVGINNLTWSDELEASAQAWADQLASNCEFKHSGDEYGENIWKGTSGAFKPKEVVDSWGSEIADYDYSSNTCTEGKDCGHYTQIVWENTTQVGCGVATCDGFDIWVCQYDPPGNFIGQKPY